MTNIWTPKADFAEKRDRRREEPIPQRRFQHKLFTLSDPYLQLREAIPVELRYYEPGCWFAVWLETDQWETGETDNEALDGLETAICWEFWQFYKNPMIAGELRTVRTAMERHIDVIGRVSADQVRGFRAGYSELQRPSRLHAGRIGFQAHV